MDVKMKDATEEEVLVKPGSVKMDILLVTSSMQNQNGVRANDFKRYSHFCKKKISKLRKLFKLTQGKRKYQKVEVTSQKITDNKILLILILECERNWSYGMYHKAELTAIGEDIKRLRHQITRKFLRASVNAKKILQICREVGDTQTQLESEAYYYMINSNYLIFKRNFEEAFNELKKATNIYEKISQLKDSIESLEYLEKMKTIKTSMRLCMYNLSNDKDAIFDEAEFSKNFNEEDISLNQKIEEIKKKNQQSNEVKSDQFEIKYQGNSIPIKNEKLKDFFIKLNELSNKITKETNLSKKIALFQDYYNKIDEMVKIVKKEKSEENNQSEQFSKIYSKILNYIENLRLKKYLEKNLSFIEDYSKDFEEKEMLTQLIEKDNLKLRVKPQEIMKLYGNLIEYQTQLINLEKENPDQSYIIDMNYREKIYSLTKAYYAGLFYLLNKKYVDSYTIMFYIKERIKEANDFFDMNNLKTVSALKELKEKTDKINEKATFIINSVYTKVSSSTSSGMDVEKEKKKKIKYAPYVYDCIRKGDISISKEGYDLLGQKTKISFEDFEDTIKKSTYGNYNNLIQLPTNTELLPPKPVVYDLIYQQFDYPDLADKSKKQSKGMLGRALGYFWGS